MLRPVSWSSLGPPQRSPSGPLGGWSTCPTLDHTVQLPREITQRSLVSGWLHGVLIAGALVALACLLLLRRDRAWWTRRVPLAVPIAAGALAAVWSVVDHYKSWPDGFPTSVMLWAGSGLLGLTLRALGWRRQRWWVR